MSPLTSREAAIRFAGVVVVLLVGYFHLLDISHKVEEGVWYMAFLFAALIVSSIAVAVALSRTDGSTGRFVWVGAAALAGGAMFGFCVSRLVALPGMADHQGDWMGTIGVLAGLAEAGLILLAGFALRDRVLQRQMAARRRRRSLHHAVAANASAMVGMLALMPALALAHGGEEMTDEEMAAADEHAGMDMSGGGMEGMSHDPLLGSGELFVAFLALVGLATWCGFTLRGRAMAASAAAPLASSRARSTHNRRAPAPRARTYVAEPQPQPSAAALDAHDPSADVATRELASPNGRRNARVPRRLDRQPEPAPGT